MKIFRLLLPILFAAATIGTVNAQQKPKPKTQKAKVEVKPTPPKEEIPPPVEEVKIEPVLPNDTTLVGIGFDTTAVPNDELTAAIKKLLSVTGFLKAGVKSIEAMYESEDLKQMLPEEFRRNFINAYREDGFAYRYFELLNIRSYRKFFTLEDIKALTSFYESPVGKKLAATYPDIIRENTIEGGKLGKWVASKIM